MDHKILGGFPDRQRGINFFLGLICVEKVSVRGRFEDKDFGMKDLGLAPFWRAAFTGFLRVFSGVFWAAERVSGRRFKYEG
ncbi:hypothetical protein VDG1235_4277 [Verrucomicrobiia bacterium DG1235]|nr:hypothetical protein VDG1235_4277 [Verrucomicrobiae bacterium DG1235]